MGLGKYLFNKVFAGRNSVAGQERRLVEAFLRIGPRALMPLVVHLEAYLVPFPRSSNGRDYVSPSGLINVCNDIYGYEVKIGLTSKAQLLDCYPAYYNLNYEQAQILYKAILGCVPTTTYFADKKTAQLKYIKAMTYEQQRLISH